MNTYIFRDLVRSFALAIVLTAGLSCCAQSTYTTQNRCSGEVKVRHSYNVVKTPSVIGTYLHIWPNRNPQASFRRNRRVLLLNWSSTKPRVRRSSIVGGKRGRRNR